MNCKKEQTDKIISTIQKNCKKDEVGEDEDRNESAEIKEKIKIEDLADEEEAEFEEKIVYDEDD